MEQDHEIISGLLESTDLVGISTDDFYQRLADHINILISQHFDQLIYLLYRVDVSEEKLTRLLQENPLEDAGKMIASLLIARQVEKIRSRQQHSGRDKNIPQEDSW